MNGLSKNVLRSIARLRLHAPAPASGHYKGESRSRRRGHSVEFADHREYRPGDDQRAVDWNVYARLGRLMVKLFSEERHRALYILVDSSASMAQGDPSKREYAANVAKALGYVALGGGDEAQVASVAESLTWRTRRLRGRDRSARLFDAVDRIEARGLTDLARALRQRSSDEASAGDVTVLISDLLADNWEDALDALRERRGFNVVVQVLSPQDRFPEPTGDAELVDAETGQTLRLTLDAASAAEYAEAADAFAASVRERCRQFGAACFQVDTTYPLSDLLLKGFTRGGPFR